MKKDKPLKKITTNELIKKIKKADAVNKLDSLNTKELIRVIKMDKESVTLDGVLDFAKSADVAIIPIGHLPKSYSPYLFGWKGRYVLIGTGNSKTYLFQYSRLMKILIHWRELVLGY